MLHLYTIDRKRMNVLRCVHVTKFSMAQFVIKGGKKLKGEVEIGGAKNAILKILPASILIDGHVLIDNVPDIEDVKRMSEILAAMGASVESRGPKKLRVDARAVNTFHIPPEPAKRLRSSIMFTGPLLARFGKVTFPHPGGCVIGQRPIDAFIGGFEALGATVKTDLTDKYPRYIIEGKKLRGAEYVFKNMSVTGTECLMMTAVLVPGKTILRNCAMEPEIPALADFLSSCGAKIRGAGTHTIEIEGVKVLHGGSISVMPDRIDAGSFAILAAATRSPLRIRHIVPEHISSIILTLRMMGVFVDIGRDFIDVRAPKVLKAVDIKTHEYPGFPTDLQAPFAVLASTAGGQSLIHETIYEARLFYIESLNRMGARITMCDPHRILIHGPSKLYGRDMESPDLRAGLAFVIAALVADGTSVINDIYSIERGYEKIGERLRAIGAGITRIPESVPLKMERKKTSAKK